MVEVNATIIVQAIHFLLVWWALDTFLFRHVVPIIQKEQRKLKKLHNSITSEKEAIDQELEHQDDVWKEAQKGFKEKTPDIEAVPDIAATNLQFSPIVDLKKQEQEKLTKEAKKVLIEEVLSHD